MKAGKVSNSVLKRSVLKLIKRRKENVNKPAVGVDCGVVKPEDNSKRILLSESCGLWPVYRAANNIYANGGIPQAAQCCVILPVDSEEHVLKDIMKELDTECAELDMQISGGHTQVSNYVQKEVVTVTGIGSSSTDKEISAKNIKPGQNIIMTKWIGISGIRAVIDRKREEILEKYSDDVVEKAYGTAADMSVKKEAAIALDMGIDAMHDVSEGGIYAALWDMAEAGNVGMDIDFRKISVCQEIIEICEIYDINPYELQSDGCLLMTADMDCGIIDKLNSAGIRACIIGKTTDTNDKIIRNLDEKRYLDTPKSDEIYRFI